MKLILVKEKKGILDEFTYSKILGSFLLLIAIPAFFILPFITITSWFFPYFFSIFGLFIISWAIMLLKYFSSYDFETKGTVMFSDETLIIVEGGKTSEFLLNHIKIRFLYNGIRRRGFHYKRDYPRNGIAELLIDDSERFFVLVRNYSDLNSLKQTFKRCYLKKYDFEEFTRTKENDRLIELEINFDWKRLAEIKERATKIE